MPQFSAHLQIICKQQHQEITKDDGVVAVEDVAAACASDGAERLGARELEVSEVASLQEPQPIDIARDTENVSVIWLRSIALLNIDKTGYLSRHFMHQI